MKGSFGSRDPTLPDPNRGRKRSPCLDKPRIRDPSFWWSSPRVGSSKGNIIVMEIVDDKSLLKKTNGLFQKPIELMKMVHFFTPEDYTRTHYIRICLPGFREDQPPQTFTGPNFASRMSPASIFVRLAATFPYYRIPSLGLVSEPARCARLHCPFFA